MIEFDVKILRQKVLAGQELNFQQMQVLLSDLSRTADLPLLNFLQKI